MDRCFHSDIYNTRTQLQEGYVTLTNSEIVINSYVYVTLTRR